jgi:hypothetical protein
MSIETKATIVLVAVLAIVTVAVEHLARLP